MLVLCLQLTAEVGGDNGEYTWWKYRKPSGRRLVALDGRGQLTIYSVVNSTYMQPIARFVWRYVQTKSYEVNILL